MSVCFILFSHIFTKHGLLPCDYKFGSSKLDMTALKFSLHKFVALKEAIDFLECGRLCCSACEWECKSLQVLFSSPNWSSLFGIKRGSA